MTMRDIIMFVLTALAFGFVGKGQLKKSPNTEDTDNV